MKKLLLAGYEENTGNYRDAFSQLHIRTAALGRKPEAGADFPADFSLLSPDSYDGLVLPGGGDIAPALFGAANKGSRQIDEPLDRAQLRILDEFIRMGKPVLGICKGLQIINVYFGGTIIQDLPEDSKRIHAYNGTDQIHATKAAKGTFPEQLYGACPVTNSAHHQAVGAVGDGLLIAQYCCDFVIEAMYHKKLPILGVQWHPERMCFAHARADTDDGSLLLHYFSTLL